MVDLKNDLGIIQIGDLELPDFNTEAVLGNDNLMEKLRNLWHNYAFLFQFIEADIKNGNTARCWNILSKDCFADIVEQLSKIDRWGSFIKAEAPIRTHSVLEHTCSSTFIVSIIAKLLNWSSDKSDIIALAFEVHDWGEARTKLGDVPAPDKDINNDLDELLAVDRYLHSNGLAEEEIDRIYWLFLLQFAYAYNKDKSKFIDFPPRAKEILEIQIKEYLDVATFFTFFEYWGYIIYGLEQLVYFEYPYILAQVLQYYLDKIKAIAQKINGLDQVIWQPANVELLDELFSKFISHK